MTVRAALFGRFGGHPGRRLQSLSGRSRIHVKAAVVGTLILLVGAAVLWAATGRSDRAAAEIAASQPPPTASPEAPALFIARAHQDITGSWLVRDGNHYALFSSTALGNRHENVPVLVGRPGHWSPPVDALPYVPSWAIPVQSGGGIWEPEVVSMGSREVMYFSATVKSDPNIHCLGTAVSHSVIGPYVPTKQPIVCQRDRAGDIDPQVVVDGGADGVASRTYLVWKSDNNAVAGHGKPLIWSQLLSDDGLSVVGSPTVIYRTTDAPQWAQPIVEAPQLVPSPFGGWWLFYSGGDGYLYAKYAVGVARCESVTGPCTAVGRQPLIMSNRQGSGPGEESVYRSSDSDWILYSPWHAGEPFKIFRPVAAARIGWRSTGPYIAQPGAFPSP